MVLLRTIDFRRKKIAHSKFLWQDLPKQQNKSRRKLEKNACAAFEVQTIPNFVSTNS